MEIIKSASRLYRYAHFIGLIISIMFASSSAIAQDGLGQSIQIYTRFHSYVGKPSLLIVIRDLDNNQNIPYLFDIRRGNNFWLLFTGGRNYLITSSILQSSTYKSRYNDYGVYKIKDFCRLESNGRIIRGESLYITMEGDLTSNPDSVTCHVSRFADSNFTIAPPAENQ